MIQFFADGIVLAAIIALGAIGLSMIYNILPPNAHRRHQ